MSSKHLSGLSIAIIYFVTTCGCWAWRFSGGFYLRRGFCLQTVLIILTSIATSVFCIWGAIAARGASRNEQWKNNVGRWALAVGVGLLVYGVICEPLLELAYAGGIADGPNYARRICAFWGGFAGSWSLVLRPKKWLWIIVLIALLAFIYDLMVPLTHVSAFELNRVGVSPHY
jgi:hypothetical protein